MGGCSSQASTLPLSALDTHAPHVCVPSLGPAMYSLSHLLSLPLFDMSTPSIEEESEYFNIDAISGDEEITFIAADGQVSPKQHYDAILPTSTTPAESPELIYSTNNDQHIALPMTDKAQQSTQQKNIPVSVPGSKANDVHLFLRQVKEDPYHRQCVLYL
jgi:hypothetical protein